MKSDQSKRVMKIGRRLDTQGSADTRRGDYHKSSGAENRGGPRGVCLARERKRSPGGGKIKGLIL